MRKKRSIMKRIMRLEQEIDRLQSKCKDLIDINEEDSMNTEKLDKLYQFNLIDEHNSPIDNDMK